MKLLKRFSSDPATRRKARWMHIQQLCQDNDFQLYTPRLIWQTDGEFLAAKKRWGAITGLPDDRRFFLFNTAASIRNIPGDTADIGVRFGTSSFFILSGLQMPAREHHMFDSFEGLSEPTVEDKGVWKKGDLQVDENITKQNLSMFPQCHIYKGWVPDRFPEVADKRFCLVHIDVDLYKPTLDSLEFFYERVNPGGVIICDDYGSAGCVGAKQALDEFFANKRESVIHIPTGQSLVVKL